MNFESYVSLKKSFPMTIDRISLSAGHRILDILAASEQRRATATD